MWHVDLASSPTRDQTHGPFTGTVESKPLDGQGSRRGGCILTKQPPLQFHLSASSSLFICSVA